jgi:hypothetical protein
MSALIVLAGALAIEVLLSGGSPEDVLRWVLAALALTLLVLVACWPLLLLLTAIAAVRLALSRGRVTR